MSTFMKEVTLTAVGILTGLMILCAGPVHAACYNNYYPQASVVLLSVNANGSRTYGIYTWDSDSAGIAPYMALKNTSGQVIATSQSWYTQITLAKGVGSVHGELLDRNSCNQNVGWVKAPTLKFYN